MPHVRRIGLEAEDRAAEFLASSGYTLLRRRFKAGSGEIDLIGMDGPVLAFVEVKQRRKTEPLEGVDLEKQRRIFAAANVFLARYEGPPCEVRFDVVTVTGKALRLYKDAFRP